MPAWLAPDIGELAARMPVVLSTRVAAGPVLRITYGFPGSESDLLARGAIHGGSLGGLKARLLLRLLLAAGYQAPRYAPSLLAAAWPTPERGHVIPINAHRSSPNAKRHAALRMFAVLLFSYVINAIDRHCSPVLAADVRNALDLSLPQVGLASTVFTLGMGVAGIPTGYLLGKMSRKSVTLVGR